MSQTDAELLAQYGKNHSDDAFAELVRRHVGLVYHSALRQIGSSQLAEEISQSVFIKLARKSAELSSDTIVTSWLYHVTRQESIDVLRRETRRQQREQLAHEMSAANSPNWIDIAPILDDAMAHLDETDRLALLLRFFENKSLREVGAALDISDDTAQKKVSRALDKLAALLKGKGITSSAAALSLVLSTQAIQAVPATVALNILAAASLGVAALPTVSTTVGKGILMTTLQKAILTAALVATTGTCIYEVSKTGNVDVEVFPPTAAITAVNSRKFTVKPRLSGRERALLSSNEIIASYLQQKAYADFTKLWAKAEGGDLPSISDLLMNTNYADRCEPIRPFLFAYITNTNNSDQNRSMAINLAGAILTTRIKTNPDPTGLPSFLTCLEDPSVVVRSRALHCFNFWLGSTALMEVLPQLEVISARQPENQKLTQIILENKVHAQGGFDAVMKIRK